MIRRLFVLPLAFALVAFANGQAQEKKDGMVQKRLMLGNSHPLGTYLQRAFWRRHCADVTWPPDQFLENRVNPSISTQ